MPLRTLIVEDEAFIALDLELQLEDMGHQVVGTAVCRDSAVKQARELRPDVVLMDLHLAKGTSGAEAAAIIRRELGIRCILISGSLKELPPSEIEAITPIAMISKPYCETLLQQALLDARRDRSAA